MTCHSKWCSTITAISQLAVTSVIVYAGLVVGSHMESWSESFKQGSDDLHSIRQNMNQMTYSMESINRDMTTMNNTTLAMEKHIHQLTQQIDYMNGAVGNMSNKFSPQGMARSFMPF
jgi:methyl-accepting chemotaxis protein